MNKLEFLLVNNPIRAIVQQHIEAPELRKLSDLQPGKKILEIGCGNGTGAKIIKDLFKPAKIVGLDIDPKMVALARRGNKYSSVSFEVAAATGRELRPDTVITGSVSPDGEIGRIGGL